MSYSIKEIKAAYPAGKVEPLWTCLVLRPLAYPGAWLAIRMGLTANQVTLFSVLVVLAGGLLLGAGNKGQAMLGAVFFNLYAWLDCVDGHVARVKGEASCYGRWLDGFAGYLAYTCVLLAGGMAAEQLEQTVELIPNGLNFVILGALAASANLLMRLQFQHYKNIRGTEAAEEIKKQKQWGANLGITGFLMPALLVCLMAGRLSWLIFFYAVFYLCGWAVVSIRLIILVQGLQNKFMASGQNGQKNNAETG